MAIDHGLEVADTVDEALHVYHTENRAFEHDDLNAINMEKFAMYLDEFYRTMYA